MAKLKGQFIVEKRNDLNEMRAIGWTSQELRYLSFYLSRINARDPETKKVRLSLSKFAEIMGIVRYDVRNIRPVRDSLLQKIAVVPFGNGGERAFQLFSKCDINNKDGEWYIEFVAHDEALPLMFEFKEKYLKYEVANVLQLKSENYIRMYEILKQYENLKEKTLSLIELRKRLGINPDEYSGTRGWVNFKIWVLDKSQKALIEKTDIKFSYEPIRQGRRIGAVKFFIEKNEQTYQITFDEYEDESESFSDERAISKEPPPKNDRKEELEQAKQNSLWYFAFETAKIATKKNKSIKATPERYAIGILKKWKENGYEKEEDLRKSGEIPSDMEKPDFDFDEMMRLKYENSKADS